MGENTNQKYEQLKSILEEENLQEKVVWDQWRKKDKNQHTKNIIFLVLLIILFVILGFLLISSLSWLHNLIFSGPNSTVYITSSGIRYHKSGCKTTWRGSRPVKLSEAIAMGRTACHVCNPGGSIAPFIIGLIITLIVFFFVKSKIYDRYTEKANKRIEEEAEELANNCKKNFSPQILAIVTDKNIIEMCKFPSGTVIKNNLPESDLFYVYVAGETGKTHSKDCRYASQCTRTHIFKLSPNNKICALCNPTIIEYDKKLFFELIDIKNTYEKYASLKQTIIK